MKNDPLLNPDNHCLLLIDHQYLQLLTIRSHDAAALVNYTVAVCEASIVFDIPLLLTTAFAERQELIREIAEKFPGQVPIDRSTLNAFEDDRVTDWVQKTGKKKLVIAGLWTEVCLQMPVLTALANGYEV